MNCAECLPFASMGTTCTGTRLLLGDRTCTLSAPIDGSLSMVNFAGLSTDTLSSADRITRAASLIEHENGEPMEESFKNIII